MSSRQQSISWQQKPIRHRAWTSKCAFLGETARLVLLVRYAQERSGEPRTIGLQTREFHETLQPMRKRQTTEEFRKSYAPRAGIESTHAQAIRRSGLRRTRYRGHPKNHLQHVITAAAINLLHIAAWANGTPLAQTRCSHFAALQFHAA